MPIRFRCAYCSQLMGIARRKSGTVVSCPRCHGQVVVPHPEGEEPGKPDLEAAAANLFDGSDIDDLLAPAAPAGGNSAEAVSSPPPIPAAVASPPNLPRAPAKEEISFDVEQLNTPLPPGPPGLNLPGLHLSPTVLLLLTLLVIILLALAFVAGLLVGKSLAPS